MRDEDWHEPIIVERAYCHRCGAQTGQSGGGVSWSGPCDCRAIAEANAESDAERQREYDDEIRLAERQRIVEWLRQEATEALADGDGMAWTWHHGAYDALRAAADRLEKGE